MRISYDFLAEKNQNGAKNSKKIAKVVLLSLFVDLCPLTLRPPYPLGPLAHFMYLIFHPCLFAHLVPCPELIFFFRVTLVTIAIMFHNPILILTLWASLLRF